MRNDPNLEYLRLDLGLALNRRATLVTAKDGGPIRTLINGSAKHPTGVYQSCKTRRSQPWKSLDELSRFQVCEVDVSVKAYLAQPHRIDFHLPEGNMSFFADLRIDRVDGTVEIELSMASRSVSKGSAVTWAGEVYAALGWGFRQRSTVERQTQALAVANALKIEGDRFAVVPPDAVLAARQAILSAGGLMTYRDLTEHLGQVLTNRPRGRAVVHAMIVHGQLCLDLDHPLRPITPLRLRPPDEEARS